MEQWLKNQTTLLIYKLHSVYMYDILLFEHFMQLKNIMMIRGQLHFDLSPCLLNCSQVFFKKKLIKYLGQ